jgi:hypothetical protein
VEWCYSDGKEGILKGKRAIDSQKVHKAAQPTSGRAGWRLDRRVSSAASRRESKTRICDCNFKVNAKTRRDTPGFGGARG